MSFVAAINNPRNISTWTRACVALAGVSDQISFTVLDATLSMLAVSSSRTTHAEVQFTRDFFKDLAFSTDSIISDGFRDRETGPAYSFVVASKHLGMLLKNSDPHGLNYVCLRVECSTGTPAMRKYKLNVEILTKKLVLKKYQIGFQPVDFENTDIPARYNANLQENDVYMFSIQAPIIKLFLDTAHASTEDFGVEVKGSKIIFSAYTKLVVKDRDYLKQPMLIGILMAIDDLEESNLNGAQISLNFRLRDLRIFLGLVATLRAEAKAMDALSPDLNFDALFKDPGDPILFQYKGTDLTINFILITADDSGISPRLEPANYVLHAPVVLKKRGLDPEPTRENPHKRKKRSSPTPEYDNFDVFEPSLPHVTYGRESSTPAPILAEITPNEYDNDGHENANDDTEYSTSGEESNTEFGPTQARDKLKSLFR